MRLPTILLLAAIAFFPKGALAGNLMINMLDGVDEHEISGLGLVRVGDEVVHPKFGNGKVIKIQTPNEETTMINIEFSGYDSKWLIAEFANLTLLK
mgnify:CR=1 FL=1